MFGQAAANGRSIDFKWSKQIILMLCTHTQKCYFQVITLQHLSKHLKSTQMMHLIYLSFLIMSLALWSQQQQTHPPTTAIRAGRETSTGTSGRSPPMPSKKKARKFIGTVIQKERGKVLSHPL